MLEGAIIGVMMFAILRYGQDCLGLLHIVQFFQCNGRWHTFFKVCSHAL